MASLYQRENSPFWWLKCRDTKTSSPTLGKTIRFSTGLKIGVGADTRRARETCAEHTLAESKLQGLVPGEYWVAWVSEFLIVHCKSPKTLEKYQTAWRNLSLFLDEKNLTSPRRLTRAHCLEYMTWRKAPDPVNGKYRAAHNTAHTEIKILTLVMAEAVLREFTPFNPVRDLGINRVRPRVKPEFTDEHLEKISAAIEKEPEPEKTFLANSFIIARYQGCRLSETFLNPLTDVDLTPEGNLIRFRTKGDRDHTAPLHPKLIPLFTRLKSEGRDITYTKPPNPSRKWFDFLKRIGIRKILPGACFHSLRVTVATRLARSKNVSESKAMKYIGHASTTIHRTYQRLRIEDLGDCVKALE